MIAKHTFFSLIVVISVLIFSSSNGYAQSRNFGIRGGYYTDAEEVFLGGEFLSRIVPRLYFNPNLEYIFSDNSTFMTFNGDVHYDFPAGGRKYVWAGGGLAIAYVNPEGRGDAETDTGLNLLFGVGFPSASVTPYLQAKLVLSGIDEFVIAFGLRF